ncbi:hypothetical protein ACHAPU_011328 [Fusarium lateritium]
MKLSLYLSAAALCGFVAASPVPGSAVAERDPAPESTELYARPYGLKMEEDGFKKRDPQNTYGKAYTLKMKDDGFKKRDPQNTYGKAYTLKMKDDGF